MATFAHIINPVTRNESEDLYKAQHTTFNSIVAAKRYGINPNDIALYIVNEQEYNDFVPSDFTQLRPLTRNITHVFPAQRAKLPFLKDILETLYNNTVAEYLIYTNLDIALMPFFYNAVSSYIANGHDAIVINRRRIPNEYISENNLDIMYAEAGREHTGYDCFIFKRELWKKFILKDICIGAPPTGNDLFYNLFAFAEKPILYTEKHLTFHIGLELHKDWANQQILKYNYKLFYIMLKELYPYMKAEKFPGSEMPLLQRHFKWLMNPTLHYPTMFRLDAQRSFKKTKNANEKIYKHNKKNRRLERFIHSVNFEEY